MRKVIEEVAVSNQLRACRIRLGLSQQEVARNAGVTRQTVSGLESGQYAPSAAVALRLARALNCRVEDLFWLEDDFPTVSAVCAASLSQGEARNERVSVARVGRQYVAHSLRGEAAFTEQLRPADGIFDGDRVQLLGTVEQVEKTVAIAGCAPALSLWARSAEQWYPGLRTLCLHANSTEALELLRRNEVHIAGIHLKSTPGFLREALELPEESDGESGSIVLIQLGTWQEGFVVPSGNPLGIRSVTDLAGNAGCRLINREVGSGARRLLDRSLAEASVPSSVITGYNSTVLSHAAVARAVASGQANIGVTTSGLATTFGLDFIPLEQTRYDLVVRREYLDWEPVRQLLATLDHRWVRTQLRLSGGFDTRHTGEVVIEI